MAKPTVERLGDLFGLVVDAVAAKVTAPLRDGEGDPIPGTEGQAATAAELAVAVAILKNNNITADADTNEHLQGLKEALEERRKRRTGKAGLVAAMKDAQDVFDSIVPGSEFRQ